jgi:cyanophycin synthetase
MSSIQQAPLSNQLKLSGFHHGLRQMSIEQKVNFRVPSEFDFSSVSQILAKSIDLEAIPVHGKVARQPGRDEQNAQDYCWLVMLLTSKLLQALKIPSIAPGLVSDITVVNVKNSVFSAICHIPVVEEIPLTLVIESLQQAHRLIGAIANPCLTDLQLTAALDLLDEKFVSPIAKKVGGGKSTISVLSVAQQLCIPFMHLGSGIYQLGWGAQARLFDRSMTDQDSAIGAVLVHNKIKSASILKQAGLPVPMHMPVKTIDEAIVAAIAIGFPVVLKPADKDRGEGVTVGIDSLEKLSSAFEHALKASPNVLIERQIPGICHRILVVNGQHVYTVGRLAKSAQGDGRHTVKELCDLEAQKEGRRAKHLRQPPFIFDDLTDVTLGKQGMDLNSIPEHETLVFMRPIETTEWGGTPKLASDEIHPENVRIALRAAEIMGLAIAGVDLISDDIKKPWYENGAAINEVNFAPLLGMRYEYQRLGVKNLLQILFKEDGRIPIEVYIGDDEALNAALLRQTELFTNNTNCFVTTHIKSFDSHGELRLALSKEGLFTRCRSLLMNQNCEALLIVVQTDELLSTGLPIDSVNQVKVVNHKLVIHNLKELPMKLKPVDAILNLLEPYLRA